MSLKVYIEYFSQPSRAVLSLIFQEKLPHELIQVRLSKKEHLKDSFRSKFALGTVPSISYNDLHISESHAILSYISDKFISHDSWYSRVPETRAKIDEYLHWHHSNTREAFGTYVRNKFVDPAIYNKPFIAEVDSKCKEKQIKVLKYLESVLDKSFIANTSSPSIADLSLYCELSQMKILKFDFSKFAVIQSYLQEMEKLPGIQESHQVFNLLLPRLHEKYSNYLD
jgi:glutathione S-transferase